MAEDVGIPEEQTVAPLELEAADIVVDEPPTITDEYQIAAVEPMDDISHVVADDAPRMDEASLLAADDAQPVIAPSDVVAVLRTTAPDRPAMENEPEVLPPSITEPEPLATLVVSEPGTVSEPEIVAVPRPDAAARPHLHIDFKPAAASATDAQAAVQFVLSVSNTGDAPARRVRMEARMLAMGGDHDAALTAFFAEPPANATPIASAIAPGISTELRSQVTMPREDVRPIRHADRVLFVPLVAFNVAYEWGDDQQGQTVMSYVVGRENRPRAAKMAPFRLDLGPRVYREVGQRVHQVRRSD